MLSTFPMPLTIALIGATGGIGNAFLQHLTPLENVEKIYAFSRSAPLNQSVKVKTHPLDISDETAIEAAAALIDSLDILLITTGILHNPATGLSPEKSLRDISLQKLQETFLINTFAPALILKHFSPKLKRDRKTVTAALTARVGSISDNTLGGWYSYRASKSALNMLLRTASIEQTRRNPNAIVVGLHPGTVDTPLSTPFKGNVSPEKLFTPALSATHLLTVLNTLTPENTGKTFAYDGAEIAF